MNISNKIVSVVIPVCNADYYLCKCVDSVLAQTYSLLEVLLIDDGSNDKSSVICDQYGEKDERVKVFHKLNEGVSVARNIGIENAQGEYITFLDADDLMQKDCIANLIHAVDYSLVVGGYHEFGISDKAYGPERAKVLSIKHDLSEWWNERPESYWWFVWGKLFRQDIINANHIRFNSDMKYLEDFCFVLQYLSCIDNVCLQDSHNILHLIERTKYSKYRMDYAMLKKHMEIHEAAFSKLEKKCETNLWAMRQRIAFRHFTNFVNFLVKSDRPIKEKIYNISLFNMDRAKPKLFDDVIFESRKIKIFWFFLQVIYFVLKPLLYFTNHKL